MENTKPDGTRRGSRPEVRNALPSMNADNAGKVTRSTHRARKTKQKNMKRKELHEDNRKGKPKKKIVDAKYRNPWTKTHQDAPRRKTENTST
jgi:hypothetical protein